MYVVCFFATFLTFIISVIKQFTNYNKKTGNEFKVSVKAYANLLPYLETRVQNGELSIAYKNTSSVRRDISEVFITVPALISIQSNGSGDINVQGAFNDNDRFEATISGSEAESKNKRKRKCIL